MKIYLAKILFVFLFAVFDTVFIAQQNVVPLQGKPIILRNWLIAKDTVVKEIPTMPSEKWWKPIRSILNDSAFDTGNWLIKTDLEIRDSIDSNIILGLFVKNMISSYEIYWDGKRIAQNGILGSNRNTEQTGKYLFNIPLSQNITHSGKHSIIIRISNHSDNSFWKWYYGRVEIGNYETGLSALYKTFFQSFLIMGLLCIPFLFNIFLYFARNKKLEHLLFSLICLIVFLDSTTEAAPAFLNLSATYIHLQFYIYCFITLLFSILLPVFFIYFFSLSRKLILPIVILFIMVMVLLVLFEEAKSIFNIIPIALLVVSTIVVAWSVKEKKENSLVISLGVIVGWVAYYLNIAFAGLATIMVICVSFSIAQQFAKSERAESVAKLQSAHLENELLKKNINPHFLLNTLTSIIAWLRKEPESAIKLVEALALEFRMINQISSLKTIPMSQEVELCKTHLQIMNYRRKSNFRLETSELIGDEPIPPMIFHTLIENGLTHGYENKFEGTFTLRRIENHDGIQYCFTNDGEFSDNNNSSSTGFGFNYIKGRLEETFLGMWSFSSHRIDSGWETVINIRNK